MHVENGHYYEFRSFRLNVAERRLSQNGATVALTPKAFDVLAHLVEHAGHLVEKEGLMQRVWPDSFVEESNIARIVHTLRKALGEDDNGDKFIETVPTKGYRFVAKVNRAAVVRTEPPPSEVDIPDTAAFAKVNGDGPDISTNGRLKTDLSQIKGVERSSIRLPVILSGVLLLSTLGGAFWFLQQSGAASADYHRIRPQTLSGEAYQNYQQGKFLVERWHQGDYEKALESFDRAIELDPNYAAAYAARADVKIMAFWGSSSHEDISQARTAVRKAIELDPMSSYAHAVLCRILTTYDWDHKEAEKECRYAVALDPNDHEAQKELAFLLNYLGRDEEALAAMDKAIALAPTSFNKRSRGMILYQSRRYDEAITQLQQVEETDPLYFESTRWLIRTYQMKGDYPRATACYMKLLEESGATSDEVAAIKATFEIEGWPAVLRHMAENPKLKPFFQAGNYAQLGENDRAFATLEELYKRRSILLIMAVREPTLDPIRNDPRFDQMLKNMNLK